MSAHPHPDTSGQAPDDEAWRERAACLDHPPEWFTGPQTRGDTQRAIHICTTCPVKQPCLDTALSIAPSADHGVWGATTPDMRRQLRHDRHRRTARPPASTPPTTADTTRSSIPRLADRPVELIEDAHGDHVDRTGRIIVFQIHGDPPYMLMIDGRPRARTTTITHAAEIATRLLRHDRHTEWPDSRPGLPVFDDRQTTARSR